jgi:hypothetical protein
MNDIQRGFLIGFFCVQGNFGGDGAQPHIILRVADDKRDLLNTLCQLIPGGRIYGPYHRGKSSYWQWSLRGPDLELFVKTKTLEELIDYDPSAHARYLKMVDRYFDSTGALRSRSTKRRRITSSSGGSSTESV